MLLFGSTELNIWLIKCVFELIWSNYTIVDYVVVELLEAM